VIDYCLADSLGRAYDRGTYSNMGIYNSLGSSCGCFSRMVHYSIYTIGRHF
jgi:hypothetical protein